MCGVPVMPGRLLLLSAALLCCAGAGGRLVREKEASGVKSVQILTFVGETVILPCRIKLAADDDVPSVEWSKGGLKPNISFLYRDGCETFEEKNPVFLYRTSLFMEELKDGNVSLRLSDVRLSDAGKYKCKRIPRVAQDAGTVDLLVGAVSEPKLSLVAGAVATVQCEAGCWFPLPNITFLDARGNDVSAQDPKSVQDSSSGCFSVTRRATVQTGNSVTCRVHQSEINQTRVTEIYIPDECMSSCFQDIFITVVVIIIPSVIIAISPFLYRKYCNSEGEYKLVSTRPLLQSSTRSNAEGQNPGSQGDPVQNATTEHRREVNELKSNLDKVTKELDDLRSKQSPVECQNGQPTISRNPSKSSQGVSKPTSLPPEQLPQDSDPKPAASADSNRPKSGNFSQNKDSKPHVSIPIPEPDRQIQRGSHNNGTADLLMNTNGNSNNSNSNVSPAAHPAFPAKGTHVGLLRSMSTSLPRSNGVKAQRRSTISRAITCEQCWMNHLSIKLLPKPVGRRAKTSLLFCQRRNTLQF